MKIVRARGLWQNPPPADWYKHVVLLWEEDDATRHDPDAEKPKAAFERITGHKSTRDKPVAQWDEGEEGMALYSDGWVLGWSYMGGSVGVLAEAYDE